MDAGGEGVGDPRTPSDKFWRKHADNPITTTPLGTSWPIVDQAIQVNLKGYEFKETADLGASHVSLPSSSRGDGELFDVPLVVESLPSSSKGDGKLDREVLVSWPSSSKGDVKLDRKVPLVVESLPSSSKGDGELDREDTSKGHQLMESSIYISDIYDPSPNSDDTDLAAGVGLQNLGNTCYMNSVLQCLVHTVPLFVGIVAADPKGLWKCSRIEDPHALCLVCSLRRLFRMSTMGNGRVWPVKLVQNLSYFSKSFRRYQQDDAHEFLTAIRTRLMECYNKPFDSKENLVRKLFCAPTVAKLSCKGCGRSWKREDDLYEIGLPIDKTDDLSMALQSYMVGEIEYNNCECGATSAAKEKTRVSHFPPILTFLLKRIDGEGNKIEKDVSFPVELDLYDYGAKRIRRRDERIYVLYAIIVHEGTRTDSGHYMSYARISAHEWSRFNDERVSRVSEEEVLSQKKAYILFYARKGTGWFSQAIVPLKRRNHGMFLPF